MLRLRGDGTLLRLVMDYGKRSRPEPERASAERSLHRTEPEHRQAAGRHPAQNRQQPPQQQLREPGSILVVLEVRSAPGQAIPRKE